MALFGELASRFGVGVLTALPGDILPKNMGEHGAGFAPRIPEQSDAEFPLSACWSMSARFHRMDRSRDWREWEIKPVFSEPFRMIGADQGHEHGTEGKGPCPRLLGQIAQIAAGAVDGGGSLQDCGENAPPRLRTKASIASSQALGLIPSIGRTKSARDHQIAPGFDPVSRMLGNVGASVEDHTAGGSCVVAVFLPPAALVAASGFGMRLDGRPLSFLKDQVQNSRIGFWVEFCMCRSFWLALPLILLVLTWVSRTVRDLPRKPLERSRQGLEHGQMSLFWERARRDP